jgi:hypothetical protein
VKTIARHARALVAAGAVLLTVSSALAQDDSITVDAPAAEPTTPPPPAPKRKHDEPPAPAAAHTEYEAAPPTQDQQGADAPEGSSPDAKPKSFPSLHPFASIVGGGKLDVPIQGPGLDAATRVSTIMLSDFGVRGDLLPWISFESELMANGGASLHGTSVFEGQASLQVRKQVIHLAKDWWSVEVGRVIDEASVDYFSNHVADVFLEDDATRDALLFDGFNLGNGVRGTAEVAPGLRLGLAANAGNPTTRPPRRPAPTSTATRTTSSSRTCSRPRSSTRTSSSRRSPRSSTSWSTRGRRRAASRCSAATTRASTSRATSTTTCSCRT